MFSWNVIKHGVLCICLSAFGQNSFACEPVSDSRSSLSTHLAAGEALLDVRAQGSRLIAVGARGHVLVSDDSALSWRQSPTPTRVLLTALWTGPGKQAWAVGHDSTILYSDDGGGRWHCQHENRDGGPPLFDIWFADAVQGLAVGGYGLLLQTRDGGKTWQQREIGEQDSHFYALVASGHSLWLLGEAGVIWHSSDAGKHWRFLDSGVDASLFAGVDLDDGGAFMVGLRGRAVRCSAVGVCQRVDLPTDVSLVALAKLPSGNLHLAGAGGVHLVGNPREGFANATQLDARGVAALLPMPDGALLSLGGGGVVKVPGSGPTR